MGGIAPSGEYTAKALAERTDEVRTSAAVSSVSPTRVTLKSGDVLKAHNLALLPTNEDSAKAVVSWAGAPMTHQRVRRISVEND